MKIGVSTLEGTALTCKMEFTSSRYVLCTLEELFAHLHRDMYKKVHSSTNYNCKNLVTIQMPINNRRIS